MGFLCRKPKQLRQKGSLQSQGYVFIAACNHLCAMTRTASVSLCSCRLSPRLCFFLFQRHFQRHFHTHARTASESVDLVKVCPNIGIPTCFLMTFGGLHLPCLSLLPSLPAFTLFLCNPALFTPSCPTYPILRVLCCRPVPPTLLCVSRVAVLSHLPYSACLVSPIVQVSHT